MSEPKTYTDFPLCPHCGAESTDNDDLCRFCGKVMVATVALEGGCAHALMAGLRDLKSRIRPLTADELVEHDVAPANFSDPADPIWDDWHMET